MEAIVLYTQAYLVICPPLLQTAETIWRITEFIHQPEHRYIAFLLCSGSLRGPVHFPRLWCQQQHRGKNFFFFWFTHSSVSKSKWWLLLMYRLRARLPRCHMMKQEPGVSAFWAFFPVKATKIQSGDPGGVTSAWSSSRDPTSELHSQISFFPLSPPNWGLNSNIQHWQ